MNLVLLSFFVIMLLLGSALAEAADGSTPIDLPLLHAQAGSQIALRAYIFISVGGSLKTTAVIVDTTTALLSLPAGGCVAPSNTPCSQIYCNSQCALGYEYGNAWMYSESSAYACAFGGYSYLTSTTATPFPNTHCNTTFASSPPSSSLSNSSRVKLCGFATTDQSQGPGGCCGAQGVLVLDQIALGGRLSTSLVPLGQVQQLQPGYQLTPAAGRFGFGYDAGACMPGSFLNCGAYGSASNTTCAGSALSEYLIGHNMNDVYSMCFGSVAVPGVLTLGGVNSRLYIGDFQFTPLSSTSPLLQVTLLSVGLVVLQSGQRDPITLPPTIYDGAVLSTAETMLLLPAEVVEVFNGALSSVPCTTDSMCNANLLFYLQFADIIPLNVAHLFVCLPLTSVCGLNPNLVGTSRSNPVLGTPFLSQYYITVERSHHRVGFAALRSQCQSTCDLHQTAVSCFLQQGCVWNSLNSTCIGGSSSGGGATASSTAPQHTTQAATTHAATTAAPATTAVPATSVSVGGFEAVIRAAHDDHQSDYVYSTLAAAIALVAGALIAVFVAAARRKAEEKSRR
eukprot:m.245449 g.245449  ORF g.245449 m.245449 type:complete len:566 (-) comp37198_c0_seq1:41-1738(-)